MRLSEEMNWLQKEAKKASELFVSAFSIAVLFVLLYLGNDRIHSIRLQLSEFYFCQDFMLIFSVHDGAARCTL